MTRGVTFNAYAKINWGLELLRKREDGYHEIRTVTHTVSLCDEVTLSIGDDPGAVLDGAHPRDSGGDLGAGGISITVTGDWPAPESPENLCWRAFEAFREAFGVPEAGHIHLHKRVPSATGLGGGSSDCIATLMALAELTGVSDRERLRAIAASLGSDTVLFMDGGAALCSGRGEAVEPFASGRTYDLVIARPECDVSTREAYGLITPADLSDGSAMDALVAALRRGDPPSELGGLLRNAFRRPVAARWPEIAQVRETMRDAGALAAEMTGSGSGLFGIAADAHAAAEIAHRLGDLPGYWAVAVQTTGRGYELQGGEGS
jgi:4-diphosphocytidyl-2-C-methyl-D-erythritol kinase